MAFVIISGAVIYPVIPMMLESVARLGKRSGKGEFPSCLMNASMMALAQFFGFILQTVAGIFFHVENGSYMVLTFVLVVYFGVIILLYSQKNI